MVGTWLGEIRPCSCLPVLPDSAWVLFSKIYQPFSHLCTSDPPNLLPQIQTLHTYRRIGLGGSDGNVSPLCVVTGGYI